MSESTVCEVRSLRIGPGADAPDAEAGTAEPPTLGLRADGDSWLKVDLEITRIGDGDPRLLGTGRPHPMEWRREGNLLTVRGREFIAQADLGDLTASPVRMSVTDSEEALDGSLSNLLRLVIGLRPSPGGWLLLHSCAVVRGGEAALFFGRSGSGKSTVGLLAQAAGFTVLSDDLNLVFLRSDRPPLVRGFPFSGSLGPRTWEPVPWYPLRAVFHLEKSDQNAVTPLSGAEALARLGCCAPFANVEPGLQDSLLDRLEMLLDKAAAFRLSFRRDGSFWPVVEAAAGKSEPAGAWSRSGKTATPASDEAGVV